MSGRAFSTERGHLRKVFLKRVSGFKRFILSLRRPPTEVLKSTRLSGALTRDSDLQFYQDILRRKGSGQRRGARLKERCLNLNRTW